ncbi:MFS transporter [Paraburkholderia silvatlantica]|uniref:DHA1 family inner membrane transport protein n=1 Tax=Paraburkholderia silvatlantica TaxID=321895 RepID=A0A2U0ZTR7_9BURK|nr:MFS transporter [Paraburkholderia silvatlantica]MBB2932500.1 DHA1 family inner membrane transport protein [Paraburkholderia silvatlantica]PVY22322.1 DHA1 family inner membrane transport protein [Paraburkholderia silvatlantica]PXW27837.1 DHA1 family inner membrane transport protein [Paraburkholderia silvatlantica]PYE18242.1 DHA1 family inner membrane transport protein [Paraburkholderia silvatlantica]TDQ79047.1 DHA1 family inner membrane transport protein [Paraburkholderia silvatlantica]
MPLPLLALAVAAFGIGTTEFVIMGLLPDVARDLSVSIPAAGMLVSAYALGVTIGAPIVAIAIANVPRKQALMRLIGIFIVGNLLCALAPNYSILMAARIVTAFCHGAFFGIGSVVAAGLVAPNRRAQAIALMFTGLTLANVLGVPLGTALGQIAGWRTTFWAVTAIGILAAAALQVCLPAKIDMQKASLVHEFGVLKNPQVLMVLGMSVLASASLFAVFTYITPILEDVTGFSPHEVTFVLLLFGLGLTVGSTLGGKLADWKLMRSLLTFLAMIAVVLAAFSLTMHNQIAAMATIFVWGILAFAIVPPLQILIVDRASDAPNLASTLNQGAFNLGNAGGAWIGGVAISAGAPLTALPWVGVATAFAALALTLVSAHIDRRARRRVAVSGPTSCA